MTDYLEEQLDNAEALLEQVRRLERSASDLPNGENQNKEKTSNSGLFGQKTNDPESKNKNITPKMEKVDDTEKKVDEFKGLVDNRDFDPTEGPEETKMDVNQMGEMVDIRPAERLEAGAQEEGGHSAKRQSNEEKARQKTPPLAAQLEKLDRAASAVTAVLLSEQGRAAGYPAALQQPWGSAVYPGATGVIDGDWSGLGSGGSDSASGSELGWAEQADRVFRRDSRRYDGGFYLY